MPRSRVFFSYSWDSPEHCAWVRKVAAALATEEDIQPVLDQNELGPGNDFTRFMGRILETDRVVIFMTAGYAMKVASGEGAVSLEASWMLAQISREGNKGRFIPVLRGDPEISIPSLFRHLVYVDMRRDEAFLRGLAEIAAAVRRPLAAQLPANSQPSTGGEWLVDRLLGSEHWSRLHEAAIRAVAAGGMAAMSHYRRVTDWSGALGPVSDKNPSTQADLEATAAILQAIDPYLSRVARREGCSLKYLGEETSRLDWFRDNLGQTVFERIQTPDRFFTREENDIRVILDGIDGTGSFIRRIPLFCSALAILIGSQPRIAATYDPIHHVVYSGMLRGPSHDPCAAVEASAWDVASGDVIDLVRRSMQSPEPVEPKREAVGLHFTRSRPEKLKRMMRSRSLEDTSVLERLSREVGAIYALNSGVLAMVEVARGSLGGFINVVTNQWDVVAGEVLVRACGGKVTEIDGTSIDYSTFRSVSVIAAREPFHRRLRNVFEGRPVEPS